MLTASEVDLHLATQTTKLRDVEGEMVATENQLIELDEKAKSAFQAEDAQALRGVWDEKRRVVQQLHDLRQLRDQGWQELQAAFEAALTAVKQQAEEVVDQVRREQQATLDQLSRLLHQGQQVARQAVQEGSMPAVTEQQSKLDQLVHRTVDAVSLDRSPDDRSHLELVAANDVSNRARGSSSRQWKIYDVDSGRVVHTFAELDKILSRWWPRLRSEAERVQEFLKLPEAEAMPEGLKQELRAAGYHPSGS